MSVYIPAKLRLQVRDRFKNTCAYCQTAESLTVAIFEIEHIVPLSVGGATSFDNLCLACPTCNRYKGSYQFATDPQTRESVPLFNPNKQAWSDHFAWNENYSEIIGLTLTGRATINLMQINRPQMIRLRKMWVSNDQHPPKNL